MVPTVKWEKIIEPSEAKLQDLLCSHRIDQLYQLVLTKNLQREKKNKIKVLFDTNDSFPASYYGASVISAK